MERFYLNDILWKVYYVPNSSPYLVDRTGNVRLATTDMRLHKIYIYEGLSGELLKRVIIHEIGHAVMASFGLISELHQLVKPEYWIEAEEWVCNLIADYGSLILQTSEDVIRDSFDILPRVFEAIL